MDVPQTNNLKCSGFEVLAAAKHQTLSELHGVTTQMTVLFMPKIIKLVFFRVVDTIDSKDQAFPMFRVQMRIIRMRFGYIERVQGRLSFR
jgi:hypothetical protein